MSATAILQAMVAATPEPPESEADPGDVLQAAQAMTVARAPHLQNLQDVLDGDDPLDAQARAALEVLSERDARWAAAMVRARYVLTVRMSAARRGY